MSKMDMSSIHGLRDMLRGWLVPSHRLFFAGAVRLNSIREAKAQFLAASGFRFQNQP